MVYRDFSDTSILDIFSASLEPSLRSQLTESGLYMGEYRPIVTATDFELISRGRHKFVGILPLSLIIPTFVTVSDIRPDASSFTLSDIGHSSSSKH